ncbi:MAG: hypothetical protein P8K14_05520 [Flavobacteriaceae bacterium]|jgi:periplasmic protein CpxP/Spy|nr:hypothetical protein [Flavobacteriaceae bacterium]
MKKLLLIPILCFLNVSVSQQNNEKLNKIFNPEQEAILTTKQLSLRLDLTNMQEKKIINFLKLHLIEGEKIRKKRKKGISEDESFNLRVKFLDHQKLLQEKFKLILDENQYKEWRAQQRLKKENSEKRRNRIKKQ